MMKMPIAMIITSIITMWGLAIMMTTMLMIATVAVVIVVVRTVMVGFKKETSFRREQLYARRTGPILDLFSGVPRWTLSSGRSSSPERRDKERRT